MNNTNIGKTILKSVLGMATIIAGSILAMILLPAWLPAIEHSFQASDPKFFWFASRATAVIGYLLLWLSMLLGLVISARLTAQSASKELIFEIHKFTSLLGLLFALLHGLLLMGDRYIQFSFVQVFTPFSNQAYKPVWVGIGQLAIYIWFLVWVSFYFRKKISRRVWRLIHFASFITFMFVLVHGITSGSDAASQWTQTIYWVSGSIFLFLLFVRILSALLQPPTKRELNINTNHVPNHYANQK